MEKERIEKLLEKVGSEKVPADVQKMAESKFDRFRSEMKEQSHISFKEHFMKTRIIKLSVAAAIIIIVLAGVPFLKHSGPSVTLAGVYDKLQSINAYMYTMNMVLTGSMLSDMPSKTTQAKVTVLVSNEYGMKMETHTERVDGEENIQEMYVLPELKKAYMIMPEDKEYMIMEFSEDFFEKTKQENNDPSKIVRRVMDCEYKELGRKKINGVVVEGFKTTDPAYGSGITEDVKVVIWVNVETQLPVLTEMKMTMGESMQMEGTIKDYVWDLKVDASEFEPVIPEDYTTLLPDGMKMPDYSEEAAIEGFKFFADSTGRYPQGLDVSSILKESESLIRDISRQEFEENEEMQVIEDVNTFLIEARAQAQETVDSFKPIQSLMLFYMMLFQEGKEPVYYGDVVTPADTDKMLMRWKTGEDEYRVIFGDLSVDTVDGAALAELESEIEQ